MAIVYAAEETPPPPDPFHDREEQLLAVGRAMWDFDWLEINAVNSTLFISISLPPLKSLRLYLAELLSFHFQLLPPLFLYWTGNYAEAGNSRI